MNLDQDIFANKPVDKSSYIFHIDGLYCTYLCKNKSAGLAGVSSEVGLDDGLLVCTELFGLYSLS